MKKLMSSILVLVMIISLTVPAMATAKEETYMIPRQGTWVNSTSITTLDATTAKDYDKYELKRDVTAYSRSAKITSQDVLELCVCVDEQVSGGHVMRTYTSKTLYNLIDNCKEITGISSLDQIVYIAYIATDGCEVVLGYNPSGLGEKTIYNPENDTAVAIGNDTCIKYSNFRQGISYEMAAETEEYIETCLANNDIEKLKNTIGLSVTTEDGFTVIEEVPVARTSAPPTTESSVLATLKADFPQYTKSLKYSTTETATALGKSVSIRVYESRNNYVKKQITIVNYGIGTLLSTIMTALSLPSITAVTLVLTALDIAYTAATGSGMLMEAVDLCRSAKYSFTGNRRGDVYDTTVYNNYVKVVDLTSSGEFTYGYDSDGDYLWIVSIHPTCYDVPYATVANNALTAYNWDVAGNGFCSQYAPG